MSTLVHEIEKTLLRRGAAPALFWQDRAWSFAELDAWSAQLASGLRAQGIAVGDRVAVSFRNSPELIVAVLATLRSGAILVPLNPSATADELAHLLSDCGAALVLTQPERVEVIHACGYAGPILTETEFVAPHKPQRELPRRAPEDPAMLMYTSGTTSRPKGVVLSQGALFTNFSTGTTLLRAIHRAVRLCSDEPLRLDRGLLRAVDALRRASPGGQCGIYAPQPWREPPARPLQLGLFGREGSRTCR